MCTSIDEDIDEVGLMVMTDENMKELNLKLGTRLKIISLKSNLKPSTSQTSNMTYTSNPETQLTESNDTEEIIEQQSGAIVEVHNSDTFNNKKAYPRVSIHAAYFIHSKKMN